MNFLPGDLVVFKEVESIRRKGNSVMMILDSFSRNKKEGEYYRVLADGQVNICHKTQIKRLRKNDDCNR